MITLSQRFGVILLAIDKLGCILRWRMREKDTPTPAATISLSKFPNFQIKKDSRIPYKCKWLFHDLMKCNVTSKIWLRTQIQWSLFNWTFRWFTLIFSTMTSTNGKLFCSILFCHCDSWNDFFLRRKYVYYIHSIDLYNVRGNVDKFSHKMSLLVTKSTHKNSQQLPDWFKQHTYYTCFSYSLFLFRFSFL